MATPMRKLAKDFNIKGQACGTRSEDPEKIARFIEDKMNQGFSLLLLEVVPIDKVFLKTDGSEMIGKDAETIVYMTKLSPEMVSIDGLTGGEIN